MSKKYSLSLIRILLLNLLIVSYTFGQGALSIALSNDDGSSTPLSNNETIPFGNFGNSGSFVFKTIKLKNTSTTEALTISSLATSGSSSFFFYPNTDDFTIPANDEADLAIYYSPSEDISAQRGTMTFNTSDNNVPSFTINAEANQDKGELEVTSDDYVITNYTIDLGDVKLGETIYFTLKNENIGKGFMYVSPLSNFSTNNEISASITKKHIYGNGYSFNDNLTFKATTLGDINTTFEQKLENANKDIIKYIIIGRVVSGKAEVKYNNVVVANNATIDAGRISYATTEFEFDLVNTGNAPLKITSVNITEQNGAFSLLNGGNHETLQPAESKTFKVRLSPQSIGQKDVTLNFYTDASPLDHVKVKLSTVVEAAILRLVNKDNNEVSNAAGFFLKKNYNGEVVNDELYIENIGNMDLDITSFTEVYDSNHELELSYVGGVIRPNEQQKVEVTYTPKINRVSQTQFPVEIKSNNRENKDILLQIHTQHFFNESQLVYKGKHVTESFPIILGEVNMNDGLEFDLEVKNTGNLPITVQDLKFENIDQTTFEIISSPKDEILPSTSGKVKLYVKEKEKAHFIQETLVVTTNDHDTPVQKVQIEVTMIKGDLVVTYYNDSFSVWDGAVIDQGSLTYDNKFSSDYTLKNTGRAPLTLNSLTVESAEGHKVSFSGVDFPITLQPNTSETLVLEVEAIQPGTFQSKFIINTNETNANIFAFDLVFDNKVPQLEVVFGQSIENGGVLDFGATNEYTIELKNTGTEILELDKLEIEDNSEFTLTFDTDVTFLRPDETVEVKVNYNVADKNAANGTLKIYTNDLDHAVFSILLKEKVITSTDELPIQFVVYPNPSNDKFYINGLDKSVPYQLYDFQGRLIQSETTNSAIDVHHLENGLYLLSINNHQPIKVIVE
ncbi:Ig-like domain-containing protein [Flammeovirga agarivorans]|uniref:Choice-of-anchor D domain-containing protein n=1 Tax=Flammeovirga agarivorans TaxID=2726742 RepID=A0A7X8SQJ0_9BACT|nr:choice-of-anchor D domain-containing protein [Flammeovirga agarivorans]NLR94387.1 choice-of-anchor D domain-containing protein [Flammeovirga agarivorans]